MSDEERRARIEAISRSIMEWWQEESAKGTLTVDTIPEVVAGMWAQTRVYLPLSDSARLFQWAINAAESQIREGTLMMELPDGTRVPYRTAEDFEGNEGLRDMLIETSRRDITGEGLADEIGEFLQDQ